MLKLRLKRVGRKKLPSYKIIIIDSRKRRDGRPITEVGFYNPITKRVRINSILIAERISQGIQVTKTTKKILEKNKVKL